MITRTPEVRAKIEASSRTPTPIPTQFESAIASKPQVQRFEAHTVLPETHQRAKPDVPRAVIAHDSISIARSAAPQPLTTAVTPHSEFPFSIASNAFSERQGDGKTDRERFGALREPVHTGLTPHFTESVERLTSSGTEKPVDAPRETTWSEASRHIAELAPRALERDGRAEFHLRITPPEIGPVRVRLAAHNGQVMAELTVSNEAVQHLVESRMPELRHRLESAGLNVGGFDVRYDGSASADPRRQSANSWAWDASTESAPSGLAPIRGVEPKTGRIGLIDVTA
jgi:flagellar hook-length control protein FliK